MPSPATRFISAALFAGAFFLGVTAAAAEPSKAPLQAVAPFLYPPYPGTAAQSSIFDHTIPNYTETDKRIVAFSGDEARKNCPSPAPAGTKPPGGVCDAGYGIYWSYSLGDWIAYNGHDGIDYSISYRPVYAAADADQVVYAGWWDPQNHGSNVGIYVRLHHSNGYKTLYGHMSSVSVQTCSTPGCVFVPHGEMLGISGTTGNSTGPHLHLQVLNPAGRSIDPYGWKGSGTDPWPYNQPESLWISYPSLVYYGERLLPSGDPLTYPPAVTGGFIIDDTSPGFGESPASCWTSTSTGSATNGSMRYSKPRLTAPSCTGNWSFPSGSAIGMYSVYIRIPAVHATSQGAIYVIRHAGRNDQVVINQEVFPNNFYVSDGWVYVGKYHFNGDGDEFVQLSNRTQDQSDTAASVELGADSIRFVFNGSVTPTPPQVATVTPSPTRPSTFTPTVTRTPTITRTPTNTSTPTTTRTPTNTRTPTATRTPSRTPTASNTPSASRTPTPSNTPRPTATPLYYKIKVYFVNKLATAPPFEIAGQRWAKSSAVLTTVLDEYFKGPGAYEKTYYGYIAIYNGFTGYSRFELQDSVANVYLKGACQANSSDYTIADLINVNLKQFPEVKYVKIYDQFGGTRNPAGLSDSEPGCLDPTFTPSPGPTGTSTITPTPSRTPVPSSTPRPTATPLYYKIKVYFVNKFATAPPFEVAGQRWARSSAVLTTVLDEYFKGPGAYEKTYYGYVGLYNGFTGYNRFELQDGVAQVYLKGACQAGSTDYTIADLINVNLKQYPEVQFVKIYDQDGNTLNPGGLSDSEPGCLSPTFTPGPPTPGTGTVAPAPSRTPTPTNTLSGPTPTPTRTLRPTATPQYLIVNVYFADGKKYAAGTPPYEVIGKRWSQSSAVYNTVLAEYFRGPGLTEKSYGWIALYNGYTGFSKVEVADGIARVYLNGTCDRSGVSYTIADLLRPSLKQFSTVQYVKIYEDGATQSPEGPSDSIPACLQP